MLRSGQHHGSAESSADLHQLLTADALAHISVRHVDRYSDRTSQHARPEAFDEQLPVIDLKYHDITLSDPFFRHAGSDAQRIFAHLPVSRLALAFFVYVDNLLCAASAHQQQLRKRYGDTLRPVDVPAVHNCILIRLEHAVLCSARSRGCQKSARSVPEGDPDLRTRHSRLRQLTLQLCTDIR